MNYCTKQLKNLALILLLLPIMVQAQKTCRIYLIGNSVTDGINYAGFENLALSKGNTHIYGRNFIPGSPLVGLYETPSAAITKSPYGNFVNAFANYQWDCVSLQPYDRGIGASDGDLVYSLKFMHDLYVNSPNAQVYIFSRYPNNLFGQQPDYRNTADLWNQLWLGTYSGGYYKTEESRSYFVDLVNAIRNTNPPGKPVLMVPVGDVMYELNNKMAAGQVAGYTSIWDWYADGIHPKPILSYVFATTFYATMYKDDPRGLIVPSDYGVIPDAIRDTIQNVVYRAVLANSLSGVLLSDIVPTTGITLTNKNISLSLLQSTILGYTVAPVNASNKAVKWISANTSIATIDAKGRLLAVGSGITTIKVKTNNGGFEDIGNVTVSGSLNATSVTGIIAAWDFANKGSLINNVTATSFLTGVSTVNPSLVASIGTGLDAYDFGAELSAADPTSVDMTSAIGAHENFSFTVTPKQGKLLTIKSLKIATVSQNDYMRFRIFGITSSVKGFAESQLIATVGGNATYNVSITGHDNIPNSVEFRIFVWTPAPNTVNNYEKVGIGGVSGNDFEISGNIISPIDNQKPTAPGTISATQIRDTSFYLSWQEASDNMVVWGYNVYVNGVKKNTDLIKDPAFQVVGLTTGQLCNVSVTAVDFVGNESTASGISLITNRAPTAVLDLNPLSGDAPLYVTFTGLNSTDPDVSSGDAVLGFDWDFGDTSPIVNANSASHLYTAPGIYTVSLRVVDTRELRSAFVYANITVTGTADTQAPTAPSNLKAITTRNTYVVVSWNPSIDNRTVTGYTISVNGVSLSVPFFKGTLYTITGLSMATSYNLSIYAVDLSGNRSAISTMAFKTNSNPIASITGTTLEGKIPFTVTFSGVGSSDQDPGDLIASYSWSVNGVTMGNSNIFIHSFTTAGTYTISLSVSDQQGGYDTTTISLIAKPQDPITALKEADGNKNWTMYPNPIQGGYLYFSEPVQVVISDLTGKVRITSEIPVHQVDIATLGSGIYILFDQHGQARKLIKE